MAPYLAEFDMARICCWGGWAVGIVFATAAFAAWRWSSWAFWAEARVGRVSVVGVGREIVVWVVCRVGPVCVRVLWFVVWRGALVMLARSVAVCIRLAAWVRRILWMSDDKETLRKACACVADGGQWPLVIAMPVPYFVFVVAKLPPSEALVACVHVVGVTMCESARV